MKKFKKTAIIFLLGLLICIGTGIPDTFMLPVCAEENPAVTNSETKPEKPAANKPVDNQDNDKNKQPSEKPKNDNPVSSQKEDKKKPATEDSNNKATVKKPESTKPENKEVTKPAPKAKPSSPQPKKKSTYKSRPVKAVKKNPTASVISSEVSSALSSESETISEVDLTESAVSVPVDLHSTVSIVVTQTNNRRANLIGILGWVCIGLGVIVVLLVLLSNFRGPRGGGRKRYKRRPYRKKKHLLNDRYYQNSHYNKYQ